MADLVYTGKTAQVLNSDAMPLNADLVIYRGDYVELFVTVKDSTGAAVNLTGFTAQAVLKEGYDTPNGDSKSLACTIPTPINGVVRVYLSTAASNALDKTAYIWDFQVVNSDGDARTYLTGDVTVYPQVTN